jgi:hypothetical protein
MLTRLHSFVTTPSLMLRAARSRAALPRLQMDVALSGYQLLTGAPEGGVIIEPVCVPVTFALDSTPVAARVCRVDIEPGATNGALPILSVDVEGDGMLLGMRRAVLAPATPDTALAVQYLNALRAVGLPAPKFAVVRATVNGSSWGLYTVEELVSAETLSQATGVPGGVVASFEAPPGMTMPPGAPGSGFARAQLTVARAVDGASSDWVSAAEDNPAPAAVVTEAVDRLQGVLMGTVRPSEVLDAERFGQFMALTALWRGVLTPDWRTFRLIYDPASGGFTPLGTARPHSALAPLPAQFLDDPGIQHAYVQALKVLSDPGHITVHLNDSDLLVAYLMLGGDARGADAPHDVLAANQSAMRVLITPLQTLKAWLLDDDGYLHLALEATEPYPVEVLGLDLGEQGVVVLERGWVLEPSPGAALVDSPEVVLRARITDVPVVARIRIPLDELSHTVSDAGLDMWVVTRVWGLDERVPVRVVVSQAGSAYGEF